MLTYHMALLEIVGVAGACFLYYNSTRQKGNKMDVTLKFVCFIGIGQSLFHFLACLDRYLAVVHPIRYMYMRQSAGIRLRNAVIGCSWLLCLLPCVITTDIAPYIAFPFIFFSALFSMVTLCILFVVSHSGPVRKSRAKRRALSTVAAISTCLVVRFLANVAPFVLDETPQLSMSQKCIVMMSFLPFCLPSNLVMPLLFLQRVGELYNCQHTSRNKE